MQKVPRDFGSTHEETEENATQHLTDTEIQTIIAQSKLFKSNTNYQKQFCFNNKMYRDMKKDTQDPTRIKHYFFDTGDNRLLKNNLYLHTEIIQTKQNPITITLEHRKETKEKPDKIIEKLTEIDETLEVLKLPSRQKLKAFLQYEETKQVYSIENTQVTEQTSLYYRQFVFTPKDQDDEKSLRKLEKKYNLKQAEDSFYITLKRDRIDLTQKTSNQANKKRRHRNEFFCPLCSEKFNIEYLFKEHLIQCQKQLDKSKNRKENIIHLNSSSITYKMKPKRNIQFNPITKIREFFNDKLTVHWLREYKDKLKEHQTIYIFDDNTIEHMRKNIEEAEKEKKTRITTMEDHQGIQPLDDNSINEYKLWVFKNKQNLQQL